MRAVTVDFFTTPTSKKQSSWIDSTKGGVTSRTVFASEKHLGLVY